MLEHRHAPEWMPGEVRLALGAVGCHRSEPIIGTLFFQRGENGTAIRASGNAMNDELRHFEPPCSSVGRSSTCARLATTLLQIFFHVAQGLQA